MLNSFKDRFGLQQHSRPAAKWFIIDGLVPVMRVIPQIVNSQFENPRFTRALDDALIQRPGKHAGKQRQHINFHAPTSLNPVAAEMTRLWSPSSATVNATS